MLELAIDQFKEGSKQICFKRVMRLARDRFHFSGTDEEAIQFLRGSDRYEIEGRCNASSGATSWVVRDCRGGD